MTAPSTFRNRFNRTSLAPSPGTHLDPVSPPSLEQTVAPTKREGLISDSAFSALPSVKEEQRSVRSPSTTCETPLPRPCSPAAPNPAGGGVTDPHLLPPAPEAMPLPTRPRRARQQRRGSGAVMPAFQCPSFQSVVTEPGLTTPRRLPETPSPQTRALQSQLRSLLRPSFSGFERPAAVGFPPADTPVGMTWAAPPPPALAGSSPFCNKELRLPILSVVISC